MMSCERKTKNSSKNVLGPISTRAVAFTRQRMHWQALAQFAQVQKLEHGETGLPHLAHVAEAITVLLKTTCSGSFAAKR